MKQSQSENFRTYCRLLGSLHQEMRDGREDKAEAIRDQMDGPADGMTAAECNEANRLSARLWETPISQVTEVVEKYLGA